MSATRIVTIAFALALGACASTPEYVAANGAGDYGHYSRKIADHRYRVNFNGRSSTSLEDTRDFALLRAAELTLAEGYEWFVIVDRETATTESRELRAGFGVERAYYTERRCGLVGCQSYSRPQGYVRAGIDNTRPHTTHSHSIEIITGKGEAPEDGNYYDAKSVIKSIYGSI